MNFILFLIVMFIFSQYGNITADPEKFFAGDSNIFRGRVVIALLVSIFLIVFERVVNRTNTFKVEKKFALDKSDNSFFSNQQAFEKQKKEISMTQRMKTMKTENLDMKSGATQEFLQAL
jgi:hypothetical protein